MGNEIQGERERGRGGKRRGDRWGESGRRGGGIKLIETSL